MKCKTMKQTRKSLETTSCRIKTKKMEKQSCRLVGFKRNARTDTSQGFKTRIAVNVDPTSPNPTQSAWKEIHTEVLVSLVRPRKSHRLRKQVSEKISTKYEKVCTSKEKHSLVSKNQNTTVTFTKTHSRLSVKSGRVDRSNYKGKKSKWGKENKDEESIELKDRSRGTKEERNSKKMMSRFESNSTTQRSQTKISKSKIKMPFSK